jgi:nucleolar complex protein 2
MGPKKKSTKKFERKHLSGEIVRRKAAKVAAQRRRAKEMRLAASMAEDGEKEEEASEDDEAAAAAKDAGGKKRLEDMSIDEFLNAGSHGDGDGGDDDEEDGDGEEDDDDDDDLSGGEDDEEWPEGDDDDEDDDEDDDDDDDDDEAVAGVKKSNKLLREEIDTHKKDLDALKETDPEFYKFLQEEDSELLDFDESEGEDDDDDDDDEEEDDDDDGSRPKSSKMDAKTLTSAVVTKLCERAASADSLGAVRNLLRAYRAAAHYGDEDEDEEAGVRLASSSAFHALVTFTLEEMDTILRGLLGSPPAGHPDEARMFKPHQQTRWKKVEPLAKSFLGNTLHLLGQLTDPDMSRFLMARLNASVPFFHAFERLTRKTLKAVLALFGSGEPALRVQSILLIRNMAAVLPPPTLERAAKGVYRQFRRQRQVHQRRVHRARRVHDHVRVRDLRPRPEPVLLSGVHVRAAARVVAPRRAHEQIQRGVPRGVLLAVRQLPGVLEPSAADAREAGIRPAQAAHLPRRAGGAGRGALTSLREVRASASAAGARAERAVRGNGTLRAGRAAAAGTARLLRAEQSADGDEEPPA